MRRRADRESGSRHAACGSVPGGRVASAGLASDVEGRAAEVGIDPLTRAQSAVSVAVASRSFSRDARLRDELLASFPLATFNHTGRTLKAEELVTFLRGHDHAITGLERLDESVF